MKKQTDAKTLWTLFKSMFVLSACTFGGGFVIVSLMKKKFVEELQWLDESEMLDITAITQSSPGPLPVNASVIIGYRMGGILGSLTAILGTIIPPMLIISVISLFYTEFRTNTYIAIALQVMRAGVAAVIMDVVWNLASNVCKTRRFLYIGMMVLSFGATFFLGVSAMVIILVCLGIGLADLAVTMRKQVGKRSNSYAADYIIFKLYPGRTFQCGRGLCGNSADSKPDCEYSRVNDPGRIYRFNNNCRDDSRTYLHQFLNLCRHEALRSLRRNPLYPGLYHTVLYHLSDTGALLL